MLDRYEGEKLQATITTTKEEAHYKFWYRGRHKVVEKYNCILKIPIVGKAKQKPNWFTVLQKRISQKQTFPHS